MVLLTFVLLNLDKGEERRISKEMEAKFNTQIKQYYWVSFNNSVEANVTSSSLKLPLFGFQYNILSWFSLYLTSFPFLLSIVSFSCYPNLFLFGVPQHLVLGPLLSYTHFLGNFFQSLGFKYYACAGDFQSYILSPDLSNSRCIPTTYFTFPLACLTDILNSTCSKLNS